jgi:hypothetical protein
MFFEVLVEGGADVPALKAVLERRFALTENRDFRIHPHRGKGRLPANPLARPAPAHQGLLDQLPAKLRGYGRSLGPDCCVLVVVDADDDDCRELKQSLVEMIESLPVRPPCVLFRIAVEETESWFVADVAAVEAAYPGANTRDLARIVPDSVIGAWEALGRAIGEQGVPDKRRWAERISLHLTLDPPCSPSLGALIDGVQRILETGS